MNKFLVKNSLSVGLFAGCILAYLPSFFSKKLLILPILYGLYITYIMMKINKLYVMHLLNSYYIFCQWAFNILNFYGVQLGYTAIQKGQILGQTACQSAFKNSVALMA